MNLAQSSHFEVIMDGFPKGLRKYLDKRGVDSDFIYRKAGLLCHDASLPGSSLATVNVEGNFTGVQQQYAHTRQFGNISLQFYCDSEYKMLRFFEYWIEYISGAGSSDSLSKGYFYRMRYPDQYKCEAMTIVKFDRDYEAKNSMQYNFISLFPKAVSSTPVSYEASQVLRINVEFNYDRYVVGAAGELGAGGDKLKDIADTSDDALYSKAYRDATRTSGNSEILPSGLSQYFTSPNAFKSFREQLTNQAFVDDFINSKPDFGGDGLPARKYINFSKSS